METLRKNWAFILVAGISLALGILAMLTALRLRSQQPVTPTQQQAVGGVPVAQCTVDITFNTGGPTPTPALGLNVVKTASPTTGSPADVITYAVDITNNSQGVVNDVYFDETLDANTTYRPGGLSCTLTRSGGSAQAQSVEVDNLADGADTTPDAESTAWRNFRVANSLTEANNQWDLNVGDSIHCNYQVTINPGVPAGTILRNVVVATGDDKNGDQTGETPTTGTDDAVVTVVAPPALQVIKSASSTTAVPGDTITYTVTLRNNTAAIVYDSFFDETLAQYTTYKAPSMSCSYTPNGGSAVARTFEIDNLADGVDTTPDAESVALRNFRVTGSLTENSNTWDLNQNDVVTCVYQVTVDPTAPAGTNLINNVVAHGDDKNGDQPNETDLTDNGSTTVTIVAPPVLQVTKSANKTNVSPNDIVTYTVVLKNNAPAPAYDVFFNETLPQYLTYKAPSMSCSYTPSGGAAQVRAFEIDNLVDGLDSVPDAESTALRNFRVAGSLTENNNTWDLNQNDIITCTYQVTVDPNAPANTSLTNVVVGHADDKNGDQPNETDLTDNGTTTVTVVVPAGPVLTVVKTADKSSVNAGDIVNYTIKATNTGSVAAFDAFFEESISQYVTYQSPSMACSKSISGQLSNVTFEIDNLADGLDETPDGESASLRTFRIAGDLTEANNTWDLPSNGDYIQCSYRVRVNDDVAPGTNLTNTVVAKADNKDGNQPNETEASGTDSRTLTVNAPIQCNAGCTASSQCPSNLTCYIAAGQTSGYCRTSSCPTYANCSCPQASVSPTPTPPATQPVVPRAGNTLPTMLLVGAGALLLILGFAL